VGYARKDGAKVGMTKEMSSKTVQPRKIVNAIHSHHFMMLFLSHFIVLLLLLVGASTAHASNVYVAQSSAGAANGASCADALPVLFFNNSGNWGSGSSKIGPGTTVHLCGTITTGLTAQGSGSSGNPITILFEAGAQISVRPGCGTNGCLNVARKSYIIVDGGATCGWVNHSEVACNGKIGSATATPAGTNFGIVADACANCEFRNLEIGPIFTATAYGATPSGNCRGIQNLNGTIPGGTYKVHNNVIHDSGSGIVYVPGGANDSGLQVYNNSEHNLNSSLDISNNNNGTLTGAQVHDNHFGSTANWDNTGCPGHHNTLHAFAYTTTNSGIDYYNNLIDGDWGDCSTSGLFIEGNGSVNNNVRVFNNLWVMSSYTSMYNGIINITAGGYVRFYNNTILGKATNDTCLWIDGNSGASVYIENNIESNCGTMFASRTPGMFVTVNYNVYATTSTGSTWTNQSIPVWYSTLAAWQSACSCDANSKSGVGSSYLALDASGKPTSSSPAINTGANLTGLGVAALDVDMVGLLRPSSGAWDVGAYNNPPSASGPAAPTGLVVVVQ
jgi:hypothetical protein